MEAACSSKNVDMYLQAPMTSQPRRQTWTEILDCIRMKARTLGGVKGNSHTVVRFQALTAASMKMTAFWYTALSSLVEVHRRFNAYCSQKDVIFMHKVIR
jgi:hypothetical protein